MKKILRLAGLVPSAAMLLNITLSLSSCAVSSEAKEHIYEDFDVKSYLGVEFPEEAFHFGKLGASLPAVSDKLPNYPDFDTKFPMTVYEGMDIYETKTSQYPYTTLTGGTSVILEEPESGSEWATVYDIYGEKLGYTKNGFLHAVNEGMAVYAELPVEHGVARTNTGEMVDAYSHLVDVRKYLRAYESTEISNEGVDLSKYDVKISMKLSTSDTSIGEPFYNSNLCLLQYDTVQKLMYAISLFAKDGYKVVIYDAYRPTSVQQKWFDVVRVHKWVANPKIGMGGVHDRGTAIDMSLIDADGNELEMPTPMHTFTEASARTSPTMSDTARANMEYMTNVMVSSGFTYINSEWWHFQCVNTKDYLPTDHPIDEIPLVPSANGHRE